MASRRQYLQKTEPTLVPNDVCAEASAGIENLLIFQLAGGSFGLRLAQVAEIIRLPELVRVPLVPPSLLGVANLRGIVLPVVSLRRLMNLPDATVDESTWVVVMRGNAPVGFLVDRVDALRALPANQIEHDDAGAGSLDPALLDGVIKGAERDTTIKILNPERLLSGQFAQLGVSATRVANRTSIAVSASTATPGPALLSLLSFDLSHQEYALPLEHVREIILAPDHISELPRPEAAVLGVTTLRDRLLPLVSLRALLGLPADGRRAHQGKVVVVSMGDSTIGVVADATREILRVDPTLVDPAPALLNRGDSDAEIVSICRLDQGRRLVALLSPDRLFRSEVVRRILAEQGGEARDAALQPETKVMPNEQFIVFRLGDQDYGMPIGAVSEVARLPESITKLPNAPTFINGVINLRGSVVPIVDLRRRFELTAGKHAESKRILVLAIGGGRAGFIIDSVSEIIKVPVEAIRPAPELSSEQMRLISRVINLEAEGRMILIVDPDQLIDQVETEVLARFEQSELEKATPAP
jgi:purine-binding chemotaxis protein CheW